MAWRMVWRISKEGYRRDLVGKQLRAERQPLIGSAAIPHAATPITVQIAEPRQSVSVYEPTSSEQAILSSKDVQRLTANLGDAPVLVAISPH